ncbi:MAG: anti-sigma factor family protein [Stellaceae bacterium]
MAETRSSNVIVLPHRCRTRWRVTALRWWPHHDTHGPELPPASTISDYDLHAFVDNALDAERRKRVQAFFAQHPAVGAAAAAYSRQNRMLRALKRPPTLSSPALGYLAAQFVGRLTRARIAGLAACCVAAAVLALAGWSFISGDWVAVSHRIAAAGW